MYIFPLVAKKRDGNLLKKQHRRQDEISTLWTVISSKAHFSVWALGFRVSTKRGRNGVTRYKCTDRLYIYLCVGEISYWY